MHGGMSVNPVGNVSGMRFAGAAAVGRGSAVLSPDRVYRYSLTRRWDEGSPDYVLWVMLNPSTANEQDDDATIRRCRAFSAGLTFREAEGKAVGALVVVNLFALRSSDPNRLIGHPDPVGPRNDEVIRELAQGAALVVAAWGAAVLARPRARAVVRLLQDATLDRHPHIHCYGVTRSGAPKHPLYLPAGTALRPFHCILPSTAPPPAPTPAPTPSPSPSPTPAPSTREDVPCPAP